MSPSEVRQLLIRQSQFPFVGICLLFRRADLDLEQTPFRPVVRNEPDLQRRRIGRALESRTVRGSNPDYS